MLRTRWAEKPLKSRVATNLLHAQADLEAWSALAAGDLDKLASLVCYQEEMDGQVYETIKTPISDKHIVIITRPIT